jgi:hypothetical protein
VVRVGLVVMCWVQLAALSRMLGGEGWRRVLEAEGALYGAGGGVG